MKSYALDCIMLTTYFELCYMCERIFSAEEHEELPLRMCKNAHAEAQHFEGQAEYGRSF